jgi:GH35 family endo-1,4-beta-xylanase
MKTAQVGNTVYSNMNIGSILHHKYFNGVASKEDSQKYHNIVNAKFDRYGLFGTGIPKMILGEDGTYNWNNLDRIYDYTIEKDLKIHFNTLLPSNIEAYPGSFLLLNQKQRLEALKTHIQLVIERYGDRSHFMKLINEPCRKEENDFLGTGISKTQFLVEAFNWAKEFSPNVRFMINDLAVLSRPEVLDEYINLISEVLEKGASIDFIGIEGHMGYWPKGYYYQLPPDQLIQDALGELGEKLNIPVIITEFDLSYRNHINNNPYTGSEINPELEIQNDHGKFENWFEYQKFAYKHFVELCEISGVVEEFYFWRLNDDPEITWERVSCGLFDNQFNDKGLI